MLLLEQNIRLCAAFHSLFFFQLNMIEQEEYRCFVGNLSWSTSDGDLKDAFKKFDHLLDAKVFGNQECALYLCW